MSMKLNFKPHSWYYGFAIRKVIVEPAYQLKRTHRWEAYIDDGNTYRIVEHEAETLRELKNDIVFYHLRDGGKHIPAYYAKKLYQSRLNALRYELRRERISYGELAELQALSEHIKPGDVELAEAAGIPEEEFAKR